MAVNVAIDLDFGKVHPLDISEKQLDEGAIAGILLEDKMEGFSFNITPAAGALPFTQIRETLPCA
jgi:hypothetical protein